MKRIVVIFLLILVLAPAAHAQEPIVGEVRIWAGSTAPDGWEICDGEVLSRSGYADLFGVIGTTYGYTTDFTFRLPNLKGRVVVGLSDVDTEFDTLGESGGEKRHTLTVSEMPSHQHSSTLFLLDGSQFYTGASNRPVVSTTGSRWPIATIPAQGGGSSHNVLDPYLTMNYIIFTGIGVPTATPTATSTSTATPTQTATPTETPTPNGTYTPMPTYTPWPTYTPMPTYTPVVSGSTYLPYLSAYTTTLTSGDVLTVPAQVSFGQIIIGGVLISLLAVVVLRFIFGVVYRG